MNQSRIPPSNPSKSALGEPPFTSCNVPASRWRYLRPEWPTLGLLAFVYLGFGLLTLSWEAVPTPLLVLLGGYLVCLHGSLQHEVVHGHPTRSRRLNEILIAPSLWLWLPYGLYRDSHLRHHVDNRLTDPLDDPESYYLSRERWESLGVLARRLFWARNTLAGRLLLGPFFAIAALVRSEVPRLLAGERRSLDAWGRHLPGTALVVAWVVWAAGMPLWLYVLTFALPGLSLTLLRSFLEHRAVSAPAARTVVVEAGPLMSLLFLNNNLHSLHHREPRLAWYRLPSRYLETRESLLADNGGYRYDGYGQIARRYFLRAKEPPLHPGFGTVPAKEASLAETLPEAVTESVAQTAPLPAAASGK